MSDKLNKEELSFEDIMKLKSDARNKQIKAIYYATTEELEAAADAIKNVWKSSSTKLVRPKRFSKTNHLM